MLNKAQARLKIPAVAATAALVFIGRLHFCIRLKIPAVAATAAEENCHLLFDSSVRLKIPAVAATAANTSRKRTGLVNAASRLPQSRRLRLAPQNTLRINTCQRI